MVDAGVQELKHFTLMLLLLQLPFGCDVSELKRATQRPYVMSERTSLLPSPESNVDCIIQNLFLEKLRSSPRQQKQTKRRNLGGGRGGDQWW